MPPGLESVMQKCCTFRLRSEGRTPAEIKAATKELKDRVCGRGEGKAMKGASATSV